MQHSGDGGTDADDADTPGGGYGSLFRQKTLCQGGGQDQRGDDGTAAYYEGHIFQKQRTQILHASHLLKRIRPERILRARFVKSGDAPIFFHPDCTVGFGIAPNQRIGARGLS